MYEICNSLYYLLYIEQFIFIIITNSSIKSFNKSDEKAKKLSDYSLEQSILL